MQIPNIGIARLTITEEKNHESETFFNGLCCDDDFDFTGLRQNLDGG